MEKLIKFFMKVLHEIVPQLAERAIDDLIKGMMPFTHTNMMNITMMMLLQGDKHKNMHKLSRSLKSARGSSSKQSAKDSTSYVSKQQQQQQEWDA
nr:hypothetical protein [Tanacetum cinerariifolium]